MMRLFAPSIGIRIYMASARLNPVERATSHIPTTDGLLALEAVAQLPRRA
jgi:hypothetical protein